MHNIDYRFYDPDMREMHTMIGYDNGEITFKITEPSVVAQNNDIFPIKDVILMQYTGYRDKNGRKIYDGDILKYPNDKTIGEVFYNQGCFQLRSKEKGTDLLFLYCLEDMKIIGNIYENPIY